jgi:hypothetical protein
MTGLPRHPLVLSVKPIIEALGAQLVPLDQREPGDMALKWEGTEVAAVRMAPLHGALDRLIEGVERELGGRLPMLGREDKQLVAPLRCAAPWKTWPTRWASAASPSTTT